MGNFFDRINTFVTGLLLFVLAGLLAWLSTRFPFETELTSQGTTSLSQASIQTLEKITGPVEVTSYARNDPNLRDHIERFVRRYQNHKTDINLKFVNPDTVPDETRNLGIKINGELVISYRGRLEHVREDSEQQFTNALLRLSRGTDLWLAFAEGHGERSPLKADNHELSSWAETLRNRGFNLQPINLAQFSVVPDNTAVLVVASPQSDYLPSEVEAIINYLDRGGNLLWLVDPNEDNGLGPLRNYLGVEIPNGTIIEIAGQAVGINDPTISLATRQLYTDHPAVAQFDLITIFPMAAAINTTASAMWNPRPVITTASHTWLESGELRGTIGYDEQQDKRGPFNIAVSLSRELPGGQQRIMVVGDGDFLSNNFVNRAGNLDLGLRMIEWLVQNDGYITIPPRKIVDIDLQLPQVIRLLLAFGYPVVLPLFLLGTGFFIWWRRKNL